MVALPDVPSVVKVRVILSDANDDEVGSSFFVKYSGTAPTIAQLNTFCSSVATAWGTYLAPIVEATTTLTTVKAADLTSATGAVGEATVSTVGTRTGTTLPLSTAFSIQYQTTLRRRGGRWHGQQRWGIAADRATDQTWTTTFVSDALAAWTSFIGAVTGDVWSGGGSLTHVGVQYYCPPNKVITSSSGRMRTVSSLVGSPGADLPAPVVYPITGYNAYTRLGSARKRLGKSGT